MSMTLSSQLSPMTGYYLRKLHEHRYERASLSSQNASCSVAAQRDYNEVLRSLYNNNDQLAITIQKLEAFVEIHQKLVSDRNAQAEQIEAIEDQIFTLLGEPSVSSKSSPILLMESDSSSSMESQEVDQVTITVGEFIEILSYLRESAKSYLGATVTTNYLNASRPDREWLNQIQIDQSKSISCPTSLTLELTSTQVQESKQWVVDFIRSCSQIIVSFPQFLNRKKLSKLMSIKLSK